MVEMQLAGGAVEAQRWRRELACGMSLSMINLWRSQVRALLPCLQSGVRMTPGWSETERIVDPAALSSSASPLANRMFAAFDWP